MTKRNIFLQTDGTHNGGTPRTKELCERVKCYCFRIKKYNVVSYKTFFKQIESDKFVSLKFTVRQLEESCITRYFLHPASK